MTAEQHEEMICTFKLLNMALRLTILLLVSRTRMTPYLGPMEHLLYNNRFNEQDLQIRQRAKFARRPKEKGDEWNPDSVTDDQLDEWIKNDAVLTHKSY